MFLHRIPASALTQAKPAQVALYLDSNLSPDAVHHAIDQCAGSGATLLMLAPPPHNAAVSRAEPYLGILKRAGVAWDMVAIAGDPEVAVPELLRQRPEIVALVCDSRSIPAHSFGTGRSAPDRLPVTLHVVVAAGRKSVRAEAHDSNVVNWLEPRFNRGF